uniref:Uncharacterized protein n=1 Tax=Anguilla anguilla TaxID=7936 RepID=A0A0E9R7Q1_ANGAN
MNNYTMLCFLCHGTQPRYLVFVINVCSVSCHFTR